MLICTLTSPTDTCTYMNKWYVNNIPNDFSNILISRESELEHYCDVIMGTIASQITSLVIVYSTVYSGPDQRKHQTSASLAFVRGIYRWPVNSPHKWPVTRKMFPFDDVITSTLSLAPSPTPNHMQPTRCKWDIWPPSTTRLSVYVGLFPPHLIFCWWYSAVPLKRGHFSSKSSP